METKIYIEWNLYISYIFLNELVNYLFSFPINCRNMK